MPTPPIANTAQDSAVPVLLQYLAEKGKTKVWLSEQTGISYRTLLRKLSGQSRIGYDEVALIRHVLEVEPVEFFERVNAAA